MSSRIVWLATGAALGVFASVKGRRAAYRLSAPGVIDQAAALGAGWREFRHELDVGMQAREHDVAHELGLPTGTSHPKDASHPC